MAVRLDGEVGEVGWLILGSEPPEDSRARVKHLARRAALTPRQVQAYKCLAQGLSNRGIAASMGVSVRMAEAHLDAIFEKLGVGSRAAAIAKLFAGV